MEQKVTNGMKKMKIVMAGGGFAGWYAARYFDKQIASSLLSAGSLPIATLGVSK